MGFTWSDFGSSEQRKRHVKPHPDRLWAERLEIWRFVEERV
ncbi:cation diffusion facilitator family transporter [Kroppenstedtia eburnea]